MLRLPPGTRDIAITTIEMLASGAARIDTGIVVGGRAVRPLDLFIEIAGSADRFPAMLAEVIGRSIGRSVSLETYGQAARLMLLEWPRIQIMRDEADALEKLNREELRAEANARRARDERERKAAEKAARKAAASDEKRAA
jgi:hypothetical protein